MAKQPQIQGEPKTPVVNAIEQVQEETLEQKIVRLEAEKQALKDDKNKLTSQTEELAEKAKVAEELAKLSSDKLKKLEGLKQEPTIDIADETYKVIKRKGACPVAGNSSFINFQFIKNDDDTVDEGHVYPTDEQWADILANNKKYGVLAEL
jgi:hypothetical protein